MTEITADNLNALADKLGQLELGQQEQALLDRVLDRACAFADETVGFVASEDELIAAKGIQVPPPQGVQAAGLQGLRTGGLSPMALKLGTGAGLWG